MNASNGVLFPARFTVSTIGSAVLGRIESSQILLIVEATTIDETSILANNAAHIAMETQSDLLVLPPRDFDLTPTLRLFDWSTYRYALVLIPGPTSTLVPGSLAARAVEYRFTGKASHASTAPERGANALEAAIQTVSLVNGLRQHLLSEIRIDMTMPYGGEAPNIVPERAVLRTWVRAPGINSLRQTLLKVREAAHTSAVANRGVTDSVPLTEEIAGLYSPPSLVAASVAHVDGMGVGKIGLFEHPPLTAGTIGVSIPTIALTTPTQSFAVEAVRALVRLPDSVIGQAWSELDARRSRIQAFAESNGVGQPVW